MSEMNDPSKFVLGSITSFDTFIALSEEVCRGSEETIQLNEVDSGLSGLTRSLPAPGNVWGWLVPAHPSQPQMPVRPLSLVNGEIFSAGRESSCSLVFQDWMFQGDSSYRVDQTSRLHFEIFRKEQKTLLVSKSGNGTFVQGVKLVKDDPKVLKHGDTIAVLCRDIELFWYLEEETMIYRNSFPVKIITKYLVGNEVGRGTFGVVRKGFSRSSYQPVALKFLPRSTIQFLNTDISSEVEILKQLDHPCVTGLIDAVNDQRNFVIVMEFAEGGELEQKVLLDRTLEQLSERTAKIQFYQICHAVAYIHSKKICHRDLKLSNILMSSPDSKSKLKISDFGISKIWSSIEELRSRVGTPIVMAPEVLLNFGQTPYTAKADCWSLGVILYQLLSGHLPHHDGAKMTGKRWEEISGDAKDLAMSLIEEDPVKRLSAVQALQHVWFQGDDEVCMEVRTIMFDTEDSLSLEEDGQYDNLPQTQPNQNNEENVKAKAGAEGDRKAEELTNIWRDPKQDQSLNESDDDQSRNRDDIRSRLRPRNQVNYNQVKNSPVTPSRIKTKTPRKIVESVKRKIKDETKQVAFLLPATKRRRRMSEHQAKVSTREEHQAGTPRMTNKMRRSRRKSGNEIVGI